ncbi:hypothetical protein [Clostridium sp. YIM B02555]|uniref:hypothetical protein n=1 Tax=Clostridium sp. YIM B02555 TaxID=2911968 RepID=UPI001EEF63A9|nr:hypothetical protein [Clostridium sp. YIM B02555]
MNKKDYSKEKNSENDASFDGIEQALLYAGIPCIIFLILSDCFSDWYYNFQIFEFANENTLLFIHDSISSTIIFFSPPIIIFLIMLNITTDPHIKIVNDSYIKTKTYSSIKIMKVRFCLFIAIIILLISAFLILSGFFSYTNITTEGIYIRNSFVSNVKEYNYNDVTYVDVSYRRGNKGAILIDYDIYLNDGKIVHADDSNNFFDNIVKVDELLRSKKIKINRQKILEKDYGDFESRFKGSGKTNVPNLLEVVLKILDK